MKSIHDLYHEYHKLTDNPQAAATLVLAHVTVGQLPENLSAKQAAERLGVSLEKVYSMCRSGQLRCRKIGRTIRIQSRDLQDFMDAAEHAPEITSFPLLGI